MAIDGSQSPLKMAPFWRFNSSGRVPSQGTKTTFKLRLTISNFLAHHFLLIPRRVEEGQQWPKFNKSYSQKGWFKLRWEKKPLSQSMLLNVWYKTGWYKTRWLHTIYTVYHIIHYEYNGVWYILYSYNTNRKHQHILYTSWPMKSLYTCYIIPIAG